MSNDNNNLKDALTTIWYNHRTSTMDGTHVWRLDVSSGFFDLDASQIEEWSITKLPDFRSQFVCDQSYSYNKISHPTVDTA